LNRKGLKNTPEKSKFNQVATEVKRGLKCII